MDFYSQCKTDSVQKKTGKLDRIIAGLSKDDASSLIRALEDVSISSRTISGVLMSHNYKVGKWAVNEWRKRNGIDVSKWDEA